MPTEDMALKELEAISEYSATGSDQLPARILKNCAKQLAKAVAMLVMKIFRMENGQIHGENIG